MMNAAIISVITSLVVSGITFIFGLKSGKNQADREKLQNLYKEMYVGLRDIRKALSEDTPKRYENYDSKTTGNRTQYLPPVTKIFYEGNNVFLNKRVAEASLALERRCMTYGDMFSKTSLKKEQLISEKKKLIKECDKKIKKLARRAKEPNSFFETVFGAITDIFH